MIDKILSYIAPHYCLGCGEIGSDLCVYCKYNIVDDKSFELPTKTRIIGSYKGVLGELVKALKFERNRSAANTLSELLNSCLPDYGKDVVVVPVPTIDKHIRQRGYDHMQLIAQGFARLRGYPFSRVLSRTDSSVQMGASAKERAKQAKNAFYYPKSVPGNVFLLIDDVTTTGSTLRYGAKALRRAGAKHVYTAAITQQTLD